MMDSGIPVFDCELHERDAFKAMFSFRCALQDLPEEGVSGVKKAIANANAFASEVIQLLRNAEIK